MIYTNYLQIIFSIYLQFIYLLNFSHLVYLAASFTSSPQYLLIRLFSLRHHIRWNIRCRTCLLALCSVRLIRCRVLLQSRVLRSRFLLQSLVLLYLAVLCLFPSSSFIIRLFDCSEKLKKNYYFSILSLFLLLPLFIVLCFCRSSCCCFRCFCCFSCCCFRCFFLLFLLLFFAVVEPSIDANSNHHGENHHHNQNKYHSPSTTSLFGVLYFLHICCSSLLRL